MEETSGVMRQQPKSHFAAAAAALWAAKWRDREGRTFDADFRPCFQGVARLCSPQYLAQRHCRSRCRSRLPMNNWPQSQTVHDLKANRPVFLPSESPSRSFPRIGARTSLLRGSRGFAVASTCSHSLHQTIRLSFQGPASLWPPAATALGRDPSIS